MNQDERPTLITVPTELERNDVWMDLFIWATPMISTWYVVGTLGWPLWPFVPVLIMVTVYVLTGEPVADAVAIPLVGGIASGMRSKLGLRRAHEWLLAFGHYTVVRTIPDLLSWWQSSPSVPVAAKYPRIMVG
jgi:hypothetical protein